MGTPSPAMAHPSPDKNFLLEEESLIILHSGEIPEVAYHGCIHFLTEDPEGPGLELEPEDLHLLKTAVVQRYRSILLRDIQPKNRDKRIYRGMARCAVNWARLSNFAGRNHLDISEIRAEASRALLHFLEHELADVKSGRRTSCINCSFETLMELTRALGIAGMPANLEHLCPGGHRP